MTDEPLSNPWEEDPDQAALQTTALETPAVEDAEGLGPSRVSGPRRPTPDDIELKRPRVCRQVGARCWAAALASWRNVKNLYLLPGDDSGGDPPPEIPFDPYGRYFLEQFEPYMRAEDGSLDPQHWPRFASENRMNWVEGFAGGWTRPVRVEIFTELLRTKGHLFVAHTKIGDAYGHVVVIWASQTLSVPNTAPEPYVVMMDPQIGKSNLAWNARHFLDTLNDHYFWIAYGGGNGTQEDFPDVRPPPP
ncbi:MAG: hypothetical protein ACXW27_01430 [Allosphingosinicella sp.]